MPADGSSSMTASAAPSASSPAAEPLEHHRDSHSSERSEPNEQSKVVRWHPETVFAQRAVRDMDGTIAVASMILGTVGLVVSAMAVVLTTVFHPSASGHAHPTLSTSPTSSTHPRSSSDRHHPSSDAEITLVHRKPAIRQSTTSTTASSTSFSSSSSIPHPLSLGTRPKLQVLPSELVAEGTTATLVAGAPTTSSSTDSSATLVSSVSASGPGTPFSTPGDLPPLAETSSEREGGRCGCSGKKLGMLCSALCHGGKNSSAPAVNGTNLSTSTLASSSATAQSHDESGVEKKRGLRRLLSKRRPSSLARENSSSYAGHSRKSSEDARVFDLAALQSDSARGRSEKERRRRSLPPPSSLPSASLPGTPLAQVQVLPDERQAEASPKALPTGLPLPASPLPTPSLPPTPTPKRSHTIFHRPALLSHSTSSKQKASSSLASSSRPSTPASAPNPALSASLSAVPTSASTSSSSASPVQQSSSRGCKKPRKEKPPPLRTTYTYTFAPAPAEEEDAEVDEMGMIVQPEDGERSRRTRTRSEYIPHSQSGFASASSHHPTRPESQSESQARAARVRLPSTPSPSRPSRPHTSYNSNNGQHLSPMPIFVPLAPRVAGSIPANVHFHEQERPSQSLAVSSKAIPPRVESLAASTSEFGMALDVVEARNDVEVRKEKERGLKKLRRFSRG